MTEKNLKNITKKHYNKSLNKLALIVVLILIIIIVKLNLNTNNLKYDNTQIILNNDNITSKLKDNIILKNNKIYMSIEDVKNNLDETIYKEDETGFIITSSYFKVGVLNLENKETITVNGATQEIKDSVINEDNKDYINISDLDIIYNYEISYIETTNIVTIDNLDKKCVKATVKKDTKLKNNNKIFSKIIEKISKGNEVICIEDKNETTKIRTKNGNIGYIKTKFLENIVNEREDFDFDNTDKKIEENIIEYDITEKNITTFKKREEVINLILQEAIKNDNMYIKVIYNGEKNFYFERFKIEIIPVLRECGITIEI